MAAPTRFQFNPTVVKGNMNGATQAIPTGSGQMLYYEIVDAGSAQGGGGQKVMGVIAYDFVNARWSCIFTENGVMATHDNTTFTNPAKEITTFIASLVSPPVPLSDEAGNDAPWPASMPPVIFG
jgi:hypothetical protein